MVRPFIVWSLELLGVCSSLFISTHVRRSDLNLVVYQGSKADRELITHYEFRYWDAQGNEVRHQLILPFLFVFVLFFENSQVFTCLE